MRSDDLHTMPSWVPVPVDDGRFADALALPTFEIHGMRLLRRPTLLVRANCIEQCFYPVFSPDADAERVGPVAQSPGARVIERRALAVAS